ncbi:homocysteine S-methyltransferase [Sinomonas notoginsengisoli]|uniref:homocysteine S-methyltransferase n=1 Tax=Sinomonas notoginsengisoli TaxID=1457311 RepID=UPI001F3AC333|nr:homocysteine S-methyltransferase [Sinomonas notoginsengisoli]
MPPTPNVLAAALAAGETIVLDGGLATELERHGHDLADPLWSAKVLLEAPEAIEAVHGQYFRAGARVATTGSYQAAPAGLARRGLSEEEARAVVRRSVRLAEGARRRRLAEFPGSPELIIAGSVGPYGAYLADGSEYRGDYRLTRDEFLAFHRPRAAALVDTGVDVLACETIPSAEEALALADLVEDLGAPAWISVTLRDATHLSDGTTIRELVSELTGRTGILAVGVNCVPPQLATSGIAEFAAHTDLPLVVYPNAGERWDPGARAWAPSPHDARMLSSYAQQWRSLGARLIGGCCRTTPADIAALATTIDR